MSRHHSRQSQETSDGDESEPDDGWCHSHSRDEAGVRPRHEAIRREQFERALRRLEGLGGVTDDQRRTLCALSCRLVASLSGPVAAIERTSTERAD